MVSPNNILMYCTFNPVSPLLEGKNNHEELPIPHVIIFLSRVEVLREKSAGIELLLHLKVLGEAGPKSRIQAIHLYHKLQLRVQVH